MSKKEGVPMKSLKLIVMLLFVLLTAPERGAAAGPFGPPQPIAREAKGLHTGIGYWFHEDRYADGGEQVTHQNQVYSELGYGSSTGWGITARVGMSDLRLIDAFNSSTAATVTSKRDFAEHWKFFSTLGAKGFYPFNKTFGMGAFIQGTYYFSDFTDDLSGTQGGAPFLLEMRVKNLWDVHLGIGFQFTVPDDIKLYLGPLVTYSEFKVSPSAGVAGVTSAGETVMKNKTGFGGYAGIEVPLAKGFRLDLEGQYAERLSGGVAVIYVY
jgi:opacity protein-like surface antigen